MTLVSIEGFSGMYTAVRYNPGYPRDYRSGTHPKTWEAHADVSHILHCTVGRDQNKQDSRFNARR